MLGFGLEMVGVISDDEVKRMTKEGWLHGAGEQQVRPRSREARAGRCATWTQVTNTDSTQKNGVIKLPTPVSPNDMSLLLNSDGRHGTDGSNAKVGRSGRGSGGRDNRIGGTGGRKVFVLQKWRERANEN